MPPALIIAFVKVIAPSDVRSSPTVVSMLDALRWIRRNPALSISTRLVLAAGTAVRTSPPVMVPVKVAPKAVSTPVLVSMVVFGVALFAGNPFNPVELRRTPALAADPSPTVVDVCTTDPVSVPLLTTGVVMIGVVKAPPTMEMLPTTPVALMLTTVVSTPPESRLISRRPAESSSVRDVELAATPDLMSEPVMVPPDWMAPATVTFPVTASKFSLRVSTPVLSR